MTTGATQIQQPAAGAAVSDTPPPRPKKKRQALLVTADDSLWPQVGAIVASDVVLKHIDSVDQLLTTVEPGYAGIVIWDGRAETEFSTQLARIQRHSARIAVIAVDVAARAEQWTRLTQQNQIVAMVAVPLVAESFNDAMNRAHDEAQTRVALLGTEDSQPAQPATAKRSRMPLMIGAGILVLAAAAVIAVALRQSGPQPKPAAAPAPPAAGRSTAATPSAPGVPAVPRSGSDSVDELLEKAAQAMLDRRYIEPLDNSALGYYHSILAFDANNAEAKQGLDRLAELLLAKAQTALDQQHVDQALQALETARGINRDDPRVQALDARLAKMRADLGSSLIQAAIEAGNYERAATLVDEAARAKSLTPAQLTQLRDDLRRKQSDSDVDRLLKTAQARVQQERLIDPPNDSAAHYFALANKAGAGSPALSAALRDYGQHLLAAARTAIDQHRLDEADRMLTEAQLCDVAPAALADLQHSAAAARTQLTSEKREQLRLTDLLKSRLAQGSLLEPDQDNAVFYLAALKAANPQSEALPQLSQAVQAQLVARASSQFDQGHAADAQATLQSALKLGSSAEASALSAKISQAAPSSRDSDIPLKLLKPISPQYPVEAATLGTEGWVDLSFTVGPNGRTSDIHVTDSLPHKVFDHAAMEAIAAARYEPLAKNQPQVTRETKLRLTFRLAK
jgi:periplasmic protein TonB